jgi:excisionase family DNA binding protein
MENPFLTVTEYLNRIDDKLNLIINQQSNVEVGKDELLTIQQAAKLLHCSIPTLYAKHSKSLIPGVSKVGKRLLFNKAAILDWIAVNRKKSISEMKEDAQNHLVPTKNGGLKNG